MTQAFKLPKGVIGKTQTGNVEFDANHRPYILSHLIDGSVGVWRGQAGAELCDERVLTLKDPRGFSAPVMGVHPGDGRLYVKVAVRDTNTGWNTILREPVPGFARITSWSMHEG